MIPPNLTSLPNLTSFATLPKELILEVANCLFGTGIRYPEIDRYMFEVCKSWNVQREYLQKHPDGVKSLLSFFEGNLDAISAEVKSMIYPCIRSLDRPKSASGVQDIHKCLKIPTVKEFISREPKFTLFHFEAVSQYPQVRKLRLSPTKTQDIDQGLAHLSKLTHLVSLKLSFCSYLTDAGGQIVEKLPHLRELYLETDHSMSSTFQKLIAHPEQFINLRLGSLHEVPDTDFQAFFEKQTDLSSLCLGNPQQLTDKTFTKLLQDNPFIDRLTLTFKKNLPRSFTGFGVKNIVHVQLKELELGGSFADDELDACIQGICKQESLQTLYLPDPMPYTEQHLQMLGDSLGDLYTIIIHLSKSRNIHDEVFANWIKKMRKLESVTLYNFSHITDASIKALLEHLPHLENLTLVGCGQISKACFPSLASMRTLKRIHFYKCAQIEEKEIQELQELLTSSKKN